MVTIMNKTKSEQIWLLPLIASFIDTTMFNIKYLAMHMHDLLIVFSSHFSDCSFGNGRIDHVTDLHDEQ